MSETPRTDAQTSELAAQREAYRDEHSRRLQLQQAVQDRDALIGHLRDVLREIASYGDDHDGICPYGCDCPHVAKKALAATPETASDELAALREDKARLDWLDEHEAAIEVNDEETLTCRVSASDDFRKHGFSDPYNVRAAIDSARKEATP